MEVGWGWILSGDGPRLRKRGKVYSEFVSASQSFWTPTLTVFYSSPAKVL